MSNATNEFEELKRRIMLLPRGAQIELARTILGDDRAAREEYAESYRKYVDEIRTEEGIASRLEPIRAAG